MRACIESNAVTLTTAESEARQMKSGGGGPVSHPPQVAPAIAIVDAPTLIVVVSGTVDLLSRIPGQTTVGDPPQPAAAAGR